MTTIATTPTDKTTVDQQKPGGPKSYKHHEKTIKVPVTQYPDFPIEFLDPSFKSLRPMSLTKFKNSSLPDVKVAVYPKFQIINRGQDAIMQCRDEGETRSSVVWRRKNHSHLPKASKEVHGRLEIFNVTEKEAGDYICVSTSFEHFPGGSQISTLKTYTRYPYNQVP